MEIYNRCMENRRGKENVQKSSRVNLLNLGVALVCTYGAIAFAYNPLQSKKPEDFLTHATSKMKEMVAEAKPPRNLENRLNKISRYPLDFVNFIRATPGAEEFYVRVKKPSSKGAISMWQLKREAVQDVVEKFFDYGNNFNTLTRDQKTAYLLISNQLGGYLRNATTENYFVHHKQQITKRMFNRVNKSWIMSDKFGVSCAALSVVYAKNLCRQHGIQYSPIVPFAVWNYGYGNVDGLMKSLGTHWANKLPKETRSHITKGLLFEDKNKLALGINHSSHRNLYK